MLTPQEVEERVFPKAKKNGYDMQDVDNFLDQLTADYTELYKENAVLKRKMKVLADKITEYQETEGAMRATLLAAQKMSDQMVSEAKTKREKMLAEAEAIAKSRVGSISEQVAAEEAKLKKLQASVAAMTTSVQDLLAHEQDFLASLPDSGAAGAEPVKKESVAGEIGASIRRIMDEKPETEQETDQSAEQEAPASAKAQEETAAAEESGAGEAQPAQPAADDSVDASPTRRLDLSELRFGRNYEIK